MSILTLDSTFADIKKLLSDEDICFKKTIEKTFEKVSKNEELTTLITKLYEDHVLGKISVKHFDRLFNIYDTEQQDLEYNGIVI